MIEVNGRVGGGVPEMLGRAAGVELVEMTLAAWRWERTYAWTDPSPRAASGSASSCSHPRCPATVAAIEGIDVVSTYPGVDAITVHQGPGAVLDWMDGSRNHIMAVVGSADDYDELLAVNRLLHDEVTVTYADVSIDG